MNCESLSDFASLIQLGAGLNFGVSILYHSFQLELNKLYHKLKVLENSSVVLTGDATANFPRELKSILREIELAAKSLKFPNDVLVGGLVLAGIYCVCLLIVIGFDPKNCSPFLRYTGIAASTLPVPLGWLIYRFFFVRIAFEDPWKKIVGLEKKYFP